MTTDASTPAIIQEGFTRAAEMSAHYKNGMTLAEVGDIYGLSRERVRQILNAFGHGTRDRSSAGTVRRTRRISKIAATVGPEIAAARRALTSYGDIATSMGMTHNTVALVVNEVISQSERSALDRMRKPGTRKFSDSQLLDAVRDYASENGTTPSVGEWRSSRRSPSAGSIVNRFGSWNAAMEAAGLTRNRTRGPYKRRWTLDDCLDIVLRINGEIGHFPTMAEYDRLYLPGSDPCSGSIRKYVDGRWSTVIRLAHDRLNP